MILAIIIGHAPIVAVFGQNPGVFVNDKEKGKIENNGTLRIRSAGKVIGMPDTIGGRVEFTADYPTSTQVIPSSTYNILLIKGRTRRIVDSLYNVSGTIPLRTLDSLIMHDARVEIDTIDIHAKSWVNNTARVRGMREVRMNGDLYAQTIEGNGIFRHLNIDNPYGVDVVNGGGFTIDGTLTLTRGELRNNSNDNLKLDDSIRVIRHVGASLAEDPGFLGDNVSVVYLGNGTLFTGPEIPSDSARLQNLYNMVSDSISMSKSFTVNDTLYIGSKIITGSSASFNDQVLTYTNERDPIFEPSNPDAEIDGSFRRTNLKFDGRHILFNNPYTYARFENEAAANGIKEMTFRIKPRTFPPFFKGELKVMRHYNISALDENYESVESGVDMTIGYGWRNSTNSQKDETNGLRIEELILQRWTGSEWFDISNSLEPTPDDISEWAFSSAVVKRIGNFAVGMPGGLQLALQSMVFLEGPYRFGSMAMDLRLKDLVPTTPPDIYPYNLDPNRQFVSVSSIPDSVVDWIVIEFRASFMSRERFFRTAFLRTDGKIVDLDGTSPVLLSKGGIDSGEYYIAIRHRNHLAVITENRIGIYPETVSQVLDFSDPSILMGRNSALKPIALENGKPVFGMIGGDVNGDGVIDEGDLIGTWDDRDYMDRYMTTDIFMNGIITTRDFNISWNNRGRVTNVPD